MLYECQWLTGGVSCSIVVIDGRHVRFTDDVTGGIRTYSLIPLGSVVERVTSNGKVVSSIGSGHIFLLIRWSHGDGGVVSSSLEAALLVPCLG